jgi:hypothetical protein
MWTEFLNVLAAMGPPNSLAIWSLQFGQMPLCKSSVIQRAERPWHVRAENEPNVLTRHVSHGRPRTFSSIALIQDLDIPNVLQPIDYHVDEIVAKFRKEVRFGTCAVQNGMSALPPKATSSVTKRNVG